MNTSRPAARIVGALFIAATVLYLVGQAIYDPILGSPNYLDSTYPRRMVVIGGVLIEFGGVLAIPLIAVFLYPILKAHDEALALSYVAIRSLEAVLLMVVHVHMLSLINVSQAYLAVGAAGGVSYFEEIGSSISFMSEWAFLLSVALVFPLGALILNSVLWRSRLVPRFLSGWGLIAAAVLLVGSVLSTLDVLPAISESALELVLAAPIALNEMVLAVWLIARGFNPAAVVADSSMP